MGSQRLRWWRSGSGHQDAPSMADAILDCNFPLCAVKLLWRTIWFSVECKRKAELVRKKQMIYSTEQLV